MADSPTNLLDNAVKYGPRGQTVRVRLGGVEVQGGGGARDVCIQITDEGPGIPPVDRERIWRAYQRGSDVGGVAGSGVGLSVVHDVVTQHGGRAWVEDAPGRGARFVVTFPASDTPPVSARQASGAADAAGVENAAPPHPRTPAPARR